MCRLRILSVDEPDTIDEPFFYIAEKPDACEHDFKGWRPFEDGTGGETVCSKCGMGAMHHSLMTGS